MAKSLLEHAAESTTLVKTQILTNKLAGSTGRKYRAKDGLEIYKGPKRCNIMLFGDGGTGKTHLAVQLLEAGLKVLFINTDFGGNGSITVQNYFKSKLKDSSLLGNFKEVSFPDADGFMEFCRDPDCVEVQVGDTWVSVREFNPDVIFWDGATAYQMVDLESRICGLNDFLREDTGFKDWRMTQNGTMFPMDRFLKMTGSDKPWHKVVTFLAKKDYEYEKTGEVKQTKAGDLEVRKAVAGTNKNGPMLHTGARKLSVPGFDLCLETSVEEYAGETRYFYTSHASDKMVKSRGYDVPARVDVTKDNFWVKYIAPMIKGEETNDK